MHKTVVIGSVIIDLYRLVDKMKNEKKLDANITEKGIVAWTDRRITEQNTTAILFVKTCTYIHHHTTHLIPLYTRHIQL